MEHFILIDSYPNRADKSIQSDIELRDFLLKIPLGETRVIILKAPESGSLTIGIAKPYGFVEFMDKAASPPYLVAVDRKQESNDAYIEFDSGGTMTPVPVNWCLSFERVLDIALYFFRNRILPEYVKWQEV